MKKKNQETLKNLTLKKVNTVGDLKKWLKKFDDNEPLLMYSDEEGNEIKKILCLQLFTEGLVLIPWEDWHDDVEQAKD